MPAVRLAGHRCPRLKDVRWGRVLCDSATPKANRIDVLTALGKKRFHDLRNIRRRCDMSPSVATMRLNLTPVDKVGSSDFP